MIFTIEDIKKRVLPIVTKYGVDSFALFGFYARGQASENNDLDFVWWVKHVSFVLDLEDEFNCYVDVVSKKGS